MVSYKSRQEMKDKMNRDVAQFGSASGLGPEGRRFESCHSDERCMKHPSVFWGGVFLRYRSVNQNGIFIEKSKGYELVTEVLHSVAPLYNKSKNSRQR